MFRLRTASRLAITIGLIAAALTWFAINLGLIKNPSDAELSNRVNLTKTVALAVTAHAESKRTVHLDTLLERTVVANESILSVCVRRKGRTMPVASVGPHKNLWKVGEAKDSNSQLAIEILTNGNHWGNLELVFAPLNKISWLVFPLGLIAFIGSSTTLMSWWVMSKTFRYLNPANVVPGRVRSALDTLAEGLALVDPNGEIAHANQAFSLMVDRECDEIVGERLDDFEWTRAASDGPDVDFPWHRCRQLGKRVCGEIIEYGDGSNPGRKFVVNATPIVGDKKNKHRGVLVSFDDVTDLEAKNTELANMIETLKTSKDEISRQNEKLNFLASYDPLTQCMNRRAFFGKFESLWANATDGRLAIIMLDVDHFKAVNDNHGHSVGDEVLKATGQLLRGRVGSRGLVCRYGGEEFIVLLPGREFEDCLAIAEELRATIEGTSAGGISYTASFGISNHSFGSMDPQHMLDQADECLYVAKRNGRNQVVRFDEIKNYPDEEKVEEKEAVREQPIAYSAVTGLLSALSFRCSNTAQHSIRVADLCVAVGKKMMKKSDLYLLEVAALLHDIGKIGVPDSILHKPGPLTAPEWKIMQKHDEIGVEIVKSAFACKAITDAIESHHYCFANRTAGQNELGESIPLAGRIITVCDAFDAMTNDRVYRKAMTKIDAVKELAANSPGQFDPEVVSKLIEHIQAGLGKEHEDVGLPITSSRSAAAMGKYIESLQNAVAEEDVETLKEVVESLKHESLASDAVCGMTEELDEAINSKEEDLELVLNLANEVMQVCRASRTAFVDAAESIFEKDF